MSQYDLLHRLQLFRDRGQPPGQQPPTPLDSHGTVRATGGRRSPLTEAETSRVRRALFGPVDHAENLRFVQQELARGQKEAEKRWNYDFVNDRPVNDPDSRYIWECSRRHATITPSLTSSADAVESSGTATNNSSKDFTENENESVQSENIASLKSKKGSEKSEKSQSTMSEKILTSSKPSSIICQPTSKTSHHPSSLGKYVKSSDVSISAPATASVTPQHESPQAGSSIGSQILRPIKSETAKKACDISISQSTPAECVLSAAATSLATSSRQSSKNTISHDQRPSRSKSLHGTQKPITGHFRERKRSKSKTKIDSRSLKLQETLAPSQMSMSNFSVTSEGTAALRARSRSPTSSKSNHNPGK